MTHRLGSGRENNLQLFDMVWSKFRHLIRVSKNLFDRMLPFISAIARGYNAVCAVMPLACIISIAFLAMLFSSSSLLYLLSLTVEVFLVKVATFSAITTSSCWCWHGFIYWRVRGESFPPKPSNFPPPPPPPKKKF